MKLCVSNIAWEVAQDEEAARILRSECIDAVEIAPTKYWLAPCAPTEMELQRCQLFWSERQLPIRALQSLLFGMPQLNIFDPATASEACRYLQHTIQIGAALGARRFVFGSPKNRDRGQLDMQTACKQAVEFFRQVAETANVFDVVFCIEPNPTVYQCNFMTNTVEALAVVKAVNHPGLGLNLDSGIMFLNGENPEEVIEAAGPWLKHFHVSEPRLAPVNGQGSVNHSLVGAALRNNRYDGFVSIEMRSAKDPTENLPRVHDACAVLNEHYRTA